MCNRHFLEPMTEAPLKVMRKVERQTKINNAGLCSALPAGEIVIATGKVD